MLYRALHRRSSERHQHLWIKLYLKCATESHPLKQRQTPRSVLATNTEEVLIPQNTENASIWGNCFYSFPHLNAKTVNIMEREMRTAVTDGIGPLRYPLMYSEWKQTEEASLVSDRNVI